MKTRLLFLCTLLLIIVLILLGESRTYHCFVPVGLFDSLKIKLLNNVKEEKVKSFIDLILFNNKENNLYNLSLNLGITYLLVVSGFHINILYKCISNTLSFFISREKSSKVAITIIFIYIGMMNFTSSSSRAFLMLLICLIDKKKKLNQFDVFFISFIIIILLKPASLFSYGFIYSFTITFVLICIGKIEGKGVYKTLFISIISFLCSVPISISISNQINMLTPIYSLVMLLPFVISLFISIITIMLPFLIKVTKIWMQMIDSFSDVLGKIPTIIYVRKFDIIEYLIYYFIFFILLIMICRREYLMIKKVLVSIIMVIFIIYMSPRVSTRYAISFLNVYQGDCILFHSYYSNIGYLVDTGGSRSYDIANKIVIPYFKKNNIKYVNVIITHNDYDHMGALKKLQLSYNVKKIYYSIDCINIYEYEICNLNKNKYDNDNDNSIVLYGNYNGMNVLLMGDVSSKVEKDIMVNYPRLVVDILKVSHHGSKYSTSKEFLEMYEPKISILSYGYNSYGHPSIEVIDRLIQNKSLILHTFYDGNIKIIKGKENDFYLIEEK